MATTYNVTTASGDVGAYAKTLTANSVDKVIFDRVGDRVQITNLDGAARIYVTVDGTDPTVAGAKTYELPAAICRLTVPVSGGPTEVRLKSSGTPVYSVAVG